MGAVWWWVNSNGGKISSDSGGLLLREVEQRTHILKRLARCFVDYRDAKQVEHSLESLIKQRVMGLSLGYEDLNDHDTLRHDPLLALLSDKQDLSGETRQREQDKGCALAGKSTLNRLELTPFDADARSRYKKIVADPEAMDNLLVDLFLEAYDSPPEEIILDVDATDDRIHGNQEGKFFHGYYRGYCYLPLYIFCDEHLLCARLRKADRDGAAGTVDELARMIERIRSSWPKTRIILRGDSGFCREDLMAWCEGHEIDYVLGLAKNSRLKAILAEEMARAKSQYEATEQAARVFKDFRYQTRTSWWCERRVIGKAEHLGKGENPRFVVTTLSAEDWDARRLYEDLYCGRGDMENRIKEQQMALFADRTFDSVYDVSGSPFLKAIRMPPCSGKSCSGCSEYRYAVNSAANPTIIIALAGQTQGPLCLALRKSSGITLSTDQTSRKRCSSSRFLPTRRTSSGLCLASEPKSVLRQRL